MRLAKPVIGTVANKRRLGCSLCGADGGRVQGRFTRNDERRACVDCPGKAGSQTDKYVGIVAGMLIWFDFLPKVRVAPILGSGFKSTRT